MTRKTAEEVTEEQECLGLQLDLTAEHDGAGVQASAVYRGDWVLQKVLGPTAVDMP